jgi:SCY1-like protein 1
MKRARQRKTTPWLAYTVVNYQILLNMNLLKYVAVVGVHSKGKTCTSANSKSIPTSALDSYMLGCLIHEVFNGPFTRPEQIGHTREKIPPSLFAIYRALLDNNPQSRLNPAGLLDIACKPGGFFDNQFISVANFLEQISIKDQTERDRFVSQLSGKIDTFPENFAMHKILPELLKATEMGAGGAKMVVPLLRLGGKLSHEDFDKTLAPALIKLYAIPDRQIRVALLENLDKYISHFDASASAAAQKTLNDKIFPQIAQGFSDTSAVMREFTLKSLLTLIPRLSEKTINNELLRHLAKLQADEEPGIRTNTTILLGKISKNLTESTQRKVLIPAFARSVKDPFPPARNAGLMALAATADYHDPVDIATKALPCVTPLMLDPEKSIRTQAFKTAEQLIKRLEKVASEIPEPERTVTSNGQVTPSSGDWAGWAGSAMAGLSKQLASTVMDKASNALIGGSLESIPALQPSPTSPGNSFDQDRRASSSSLSSQPKSASLKLGSASKLPTVTLPEATGWGDWGVDASLDAELDTRNSIDDMFSRKSNLPRPLQPQKSAEKTEFTKPFVPSFASNTDDIPSLAPPPSFKSTVKSPIVSPSANGDFATFPPPKQESAPKSSMSLPKKTQAPPSAEWDAWADNFMAAAKPTSSSDRDKKKAERDERLAQLKAQRAAKK